MDSVIPIHRHKNTAETYILLRGKISVEFYNENGDITELIDLDPTTGHYGIDIPQGQWHSLKVLAPDSVIFEVKDGPYTPITAEDILSKD